MYQMHRPKRWHEYPRPIPNDNVLRGLLLDDIYCENKGRKKWQNTYGKMIELYRENYRTKPGLGCEAGKLPAEIPVADKSAIECSMVPGHPTSGESTQKVRFSDCPPSSSDSVPPAIIQNTEKEKSCDCKPRFRTLAKFPPQCAHVCARMGFPCWMCDPKSNKIECPET